VVDTIALPENNNLLINLNIMKTQNNKLAFSKKSITELTDSQSKTVNGGCQWSHSSGPTLSIKLSIIQVPTQQEDIMM